MIFNSSTTLNRRDISVGPKTLLKEGPKKWYS